MKKPVLFTLFMCIVCLVKANFLISAHRGNSSVAPENTLISFQKAIDVGADFFECDVKFTNDDSIVTFHDQTLNRTTNGYGDISSYNYSVLKNLDAGYQTKFGYLYYGEQIPTLREALILAKNKIKVEIEIKDFNMADDVVSIINDLEMENQVLVISFKLSEIQRVKQLDSSIPVKYLVGTSWGQNEINELLAIGGEYIGPNGVPSPNQVQLAHSNNIKIISYTLNSESQIEAAMDAGLDGIATDYPERALDIRQRRDMLNNSLIAHWDMNTIQNNYMIDMTNHGGDAQMYGNLNFEKRGRYNSLKYNGSNNYLRVTSSSELIKSLNSMTISTWVNLSLLPSQLPSHHGPIYDSNEDSYVLYMDRNNDNITFKVSTTQGSKKTTIPSSMFSTNKWIHLCGIYTGSEVKFYLNGVLVDSEDLTGIISRTQNPYIGKNGTTSEFFKGNIGDIKIYDSAIAIADIKELAKPSDLIAHWKMDQIETNDMMTDHSSYEHHASINGFPSIVNTPPLALDFNGVMDYLEVPSGSQAPLLDDIGEQVTITSWINLNKLPSEISGPDSPIFDSDQDNYILFLNKASQELRLKITTEQGVQRPGIPQNLLAKNQWIFVTAVYDGNSAKIYLNKELVDSNQLSGKIRSGQVAYIGKSGASNLFFDGQMGEMRIYNYALSQSEIDTLFEDGERYKTITSIEKPTDLVDLVIAPNPAHEHLTITRNHTGEALLSIVDIQGRTILNNQAIRDKVIQINVSDYSLQPGTYILRIIENDKVKSSKIIIR